MDLIQKKNAKPTEIVGEIRTTEAAWEQIILYLEQTISLPETKNMLMAICHQLIDAILDDIAKGKIIGEDIKEALDYIARVEKMSPKEFLRETKVDQYIEIGGG